MPHLVALATLLVGLAATAGLTVVAAVNYDHNESHLLRLRAQDAGALISEAIPTILTPLASGTEVAIAAGDPSRFATFMSSYVKTGGVVSASLWSDANGQPRLLAVTGSAPDLPVSSPTTAGLFERALSSHQLTLIKVERPPVVHLVLAYSPPGSSTIAVEESVVDQHRASIASSQAFANLEYAIYVGRHPVTSNLLTTDAPRLPMAGRTAEDVVPFGQDAFTIVLHPTVSLQGAFPEYLPLIIGVIGVIVSLMAMILVERLVRRRETAEAIAVQRDEVAAENRRLYDEQRNIADTLQRALLPKDLPQPPGAEVRARYVAGGAGVEVGGDWYDVVSLDGDEFLFVVGDVSGSGLRAATVMAELRFATRAYVAEGVPPAELLTKLSRLYNFDTDGHFATVLCGHVKLSSGQMEIANAGHLNPLLGQESGYQLLTTPVGVPIGVDPGRQYQSVTVRLPDQGTLLAFTDGLIERRGQNIDSALLRLRDAAARRNDPLVELLDRLLGEFGPDGFDDDAAILGVRWLN
jgi:serine phosphatase RsbU (regulator of sigma subunit)